MCNFKNIFLGIIFCTTNISTFAMQELLKTLHELEKKPVVVFWHYDIQARGISVYYPSDFLIYPIHAAAISGDVEAARNLIPDIDVNFVCDSPGYPHSGKTPLHLATEFGNVEMVKFLLQNGAIAVINTPAINAGSEYHNMNPLNIALSGREFSKKYTPQRCEKYNQIITILLAAGAQPSEPQPAQS